MFGKIEVWAVGLLLIAGVIFTVIFGVMVRNRALGFDRFGVLGEVAFTIADAPAAVRAMLTRDTRLRAIKGGKRFEGQNGWRIPDPAGVQGLEGYLLLSRTDGDISRQVVDLVDLRTFQTVHTWMPDAEMLFGEFPRCATCVNPIRNESFRPIEPYAYPNGDLLVKDHYSPIARVSACGEKLWVEETVFHHATELDADGDIWSPIDVREAGQPQIGNRQNDYLGDGLGHMSADGEMIAKYDLTELLKANGYRHLLVGMAGTYEKDPMHLNDVEPILADGRFWKKGDVLFSMRNKSTIALFRPSTGKILWLKSGPWIAQHDVDVIGDGKISIFDNGINREVSPPEPGDHNRVVVYDFATDTVTSPYDAAFAELDLKTETEGLQQALPNGFLMAEETNYGRLVILGPDGKLAAEYINGAKDGFNYLLGWSRYVPQALGDQVAEATRGLTCGG
ncbi:MAG: arylsulfotransferase family protein [Albidovulum sp.]